MKIPTKKQIKKAAEKSNEMQRETMRVANFKKKQLKKLKEFLFELLAPIESKELDWIIHLEPFISHLIDLAIAEGRKEKEKEFIKNLPQMRLLNKDNPQYVLGWNACRMNMEMGIKGRIVKGEYVFGREDIEKCFKCGKKLIPDPEALSERTGKWDEHSFKFDCSCNRKDLRVCIG